MEIINHECYVSFEVAKLLKEVGFDWECRYCYDVETKDFLDDNEGEFNFNEDDDNDFYSAPTLEVVQRWLREVKGYSIYPTRGGYKIYVLDIDDSAGFSRTYGLNSNLTYEEALETGIKKALELILEKGE